MKRNHYMLAGILCMAFPLLSQAQTQPADSTLTRTVVVEQEYNPDIMDASKVNIVPPVQEPTVSRKEVEYDVSNKPATSLQSPAIGAYTATEAQQRYTPGYVRAGYGSRGNLDLFANYLFRISPKDRLNLNVSMEGMNGKTPEAEVSGIYQNRWSSFYYRTKAGALYQHTFDQLDLNIGGNFALNNFNMIPLTYASNQKLSSGDFHIGVQSKDDDAPLRYTAETNLMLYSRKRDEIPTTNKETIIRTKADVNGKLQEEQYVGLALQMNNLFYTYGQEYLGSDNYTTIDLNPYFLWDTDTWQLRLGAHVDFSLGSGTTFRAAPDVEAGYTFSETYKVYAAATGGRILNDFRRLEENTPYGFLSGAKPEDSYELIKGRIGLKGSPHPGVWFHLFGGYQNIRNEIYHLSYLRNPSSSLSIIAQSTAISYRTAHTNNLHAGAEFGYDYKDIVSLSLAGTGYSWNTKENYSLYLKPLFRLKAEAGIRPISPLWITASYEYIGHEKVKIGDSGYNERISAVNDLRFSATYHLYKGVSIYANINNVLNKKNQYYLFYPVQGFNFLGGLSFQF